MATLAAVAVPTRRRRNAEGRDDGARRFDAAPAAPAEVSHNLAGQRLGRKGRVTRERILAAASELIERPEEGPISMSAIARRASLGMTSLYNYFADLTEVVLALLEPVMESAEHAFFASLRTRWSDGDLDARCLAFVAAYFGYWSRNSRLLHLRNAMADSLDARMIRQRVAASQPVIDALVVQMIGDAGDDGETAATAAMMMIAIERSITIATDQQLRQTGGWQVDTEDRFVQPAARLLRLAIADARVRAAGADRHHARSL